MEYNKWHYEVLNRFKEFNVNDILNFKVNHPHWYSLILICEWGYYCEDRHCSYDDFGKWREKYNL